MSMADDPWTLTPQAPAGLPAIPVAAPAAVSHADDGPAPEPEPEPTPEIVPEPASEPEPVPVPAVADAGPVGETTERMEPVATPGPVEAVGTAALADAADPADDADGTTAVRTAGRVRPDRRLAVGIVAAALLACACAGGVAAVRAHMRSSALESARASCSQAVASRDRTWRSLASVLEGKDTATAKKLKAVDLEKSDSGLPARLRTMLDAASKATRPALSCSAGDTDVLDATRARADGQRAAWERERGDIDALVSSMLASRSARALTDAKGAYSKSAATGRSLLASARGKVADASTLTALEHALDAEPGTTAESLGTAATAIDRAAAAVRASMDAKTKADKAKADKAEAEAQAGRSTTGQDTGARAATPQWDAPQATQTPRTQAPRAATPEAGSGSSGSGSESAPSWSVPAPSSDGSLGDRDPGL
ncbi:MAG: hypothetical protein U0N15_01205 [Bifidobacterium choerinum]